MTAPSAHFRRHFDVEPPRVDRSRFHQAWRVQTKLDELLAHRAIRPQEWRRAVAFRRDLELVLSAAYPSPPKLGLPSGSRRESALSAVRLDVLVRIGKTCTALGPVMCTLLRFALVEDPTWVALGAWLRVDPRTARAWVVRCIKALADG